MSKTLSCAAWLLLMAFTLSATSPPDTEDKRVVQLPAGGGTMKIPSDWQVLGADEPARIYNHETQELETHKRTNRDVSRMVQVMKYPLPRKGSNPFVTVEWHDHDDYPEGMAMGGVKHLGTIRRDVIVNFYGNIDIQVEPKEIGISGGAMWAFEAQLPARVAEFAGWSGADYVQEYIIPGNGGFWVVTGIYPKDGLDKGIEGAQEVEDILQSIGELRNLREVERQGMVEN